jgi:uncharacterized phage protein (TIGR01671 family)
MLYEGFDISPDGNVWINNFSVKEQFYIIQFTGLIDMNGKEIYDGDIIQSSDANKNIFKIILWVWGLGGITKDGTPVNFNGIPHKDNLTFDTVPTWEIIGNIHENPELIFIES